MSIDSQELLFDDDNLFAEDSGIEEDDDLFLSEDSDDDLFTAEDSDEGIEAESGKWKVMIVDDEPQIHTVTKIAMRDFSFEGKKLEFIHAYSGKEAQSLIAQHPDTALILLDVVMEDDHAGLNVVKYIRSELKNNLVRIILRTGQPGQAPEEKVILNYDINDYKEKTEMTVTKLYTSLISALRSYRDLNIIENNKKGLEKIIESSSNLFEFQSMKEFSSGVLTQLISLLGLNKNSLYCQASGFAATRGNEGFYILAATGDFYKDIGQNIQGAVRDAVIQDLEKAYFKKKNLFFENRFVIYFQSKIGSESMIYMEGLKQLDIWDIDLIEIFSTNVSIAFDNLYLNKELEDTQKEVIFTLGEIAEARSKETSNHVKRVAEYSKLLALEYGLSEDESEILRLASPMHDIGKLGIPDNILNKPGKLTPEEFDVIKTHSKLGYEMLKKSNRKILKTAQVIALEHHEKYNGTGYPKGLRGEEISIEGRIIALADVFDALGSDRVYKKAWALEDILQLLKKERGEHFDPKLVDIFLGNLDKILLIRDKFKDTIF